MQIRKFLLQLTQSSKSKGLYMIFNLFSPFQIYYKTAYSFSLRKHWMHAWKNNIFLSEMFLFRTNKIQKILFQISLYISHLKKSIFDRLWFSCKSRVPLTSYTTVIAKKTILISTLLKNNKNLTHMSKVLYTIITKNLKYFISPPPPQKKI